MFEDHPTVEDFTGFLQDASRPGHATRNAKILRHLLAECPACRGQLQAMGWPARRLERLVYLPGAQNGQTEPQAADGFNYMNAFARADRSVSDLLSATPQPAIPPGQLLEELDRTAPDRRAALVEEDERFASPRLVHWLIERSHEDRYSDPGAMLHWATVARSIATRCSPEALGNAAKTADLRARAWGQYGNALRVAGRLREASEAMITAQGYLEAGTGEPALHAKLAEQVASLHTFQRRFDAAIASLEEAVEIYRQLGESHALARTLVQQAIASLYAGDPESAVQLLNRAIPLIDHEEDPHLLLAACHNLVRCYIDLDRPEQALSIYSETRDLYKEFSDSLIQLRAGWQEGQLLRDLGHLRAAETTLIRARSGFMERGLIYEVAVVCLDLAALYVKLKSTEDLKQTVTATVPIFRSLGVDRDGLASLLQLQQVAHQEEEALDLIRFLNARIEPFSQRRLLR
ncbi:MAG TPA: tetratricopeptide repeat protein [Thermoanaerobaculia bacterium]|jgi:tetratricopeptide (TPR) repeat protein|nr:tetratricopeptide repeat protein [Thermoanaerobaculia bacterium]